MNSNNNSNIEKVTITRRTRIGFGWTIYSDGDVSPQYWGTVKTLTEKILGDREYNACRHCINRRRYFVRVDGDLRAIDKDSVQWMELGCLYHTDPYCRVDAVDVPLLPKQ